MLKVVVLTFIIVAIAVLLLSVRVLLVRQGTFKSQHVHDNEALRRKGIGCVLEQDREAQQVHQTLHHNANSKH